MFLSILQLGKLKGGEGRYGRHGGEVQLSWQTLFYQLKKGPKVDKLNCRPNDGEKNVKSTNNAKNRLSDRQKNIKSQIIPRGI